MPVEKFCFFFLMGAFVWLETTFFNRHFFNTVKREIDTFSNENDRKFDLNNRYEVHFVMQIH